VHVGSAELEEGAVAYLESIFTTSSRWHAHSGAEHEQMKKMNSSHSCSSCCDSGTRSEKCIACVNRTDRSVFTIQKKLVDLFAQPIQTMRFARPSGQCFDTFVIYSWATSILAFSYR
jgi:hypothetical protein